MARFLGKVLGLGLATKKCVCSTNQKALKNASYRQAISMEENNILRFFQHVVQRADAVKHIRGVSVEHNVSRQFSQKLAE